MLYDGSVQLSDFKDLMRKVDNASVVRACIKWSQLVKVAVTLSVASMDKAR